MDAGHPDFSGRQIVSRSFVDDRDAHDGKGHGTHCAGIACGPAFPTAAPRYGVDGAAQLFVGKVLGDEGRGDYSGVLEGINWAIATQCDLLFMSLGSSIASDQTDSKVLSEVHSRAMEPGTVNIGATSNPTRTPD